MEMDGWMDGRQPCRLGDVVHRQLVFPLFDERQRDAIVRRRDELILTQRLEAIDSLPHVLHGHLVVPLPAINLTQRRQQIPHSPVEISLHTRVANHRARKQKLPR